MQRCVILLKKEKGDTVVNVKEVGEVYECDICGNVVEIKTVGGGELICCMKPIGRVE